MLRRLRHLVLCAAEGLALIVQSPRKLAVAPEGLMCYAAQLLDQPVPRAVRNVVEADVFGVPQDVEGGLLHFSRLGRLSAKRGAGSTAGVIPGRRAFRSSGLLGASLGRAEL